MNTHTMTLTKTHEGTETWFCPDCGRTLLIEWQPWRKVTTVEGDPYAMHTGGKGGLVIGNVSINS